MNRPARGRLNASGTARKADTDLPILQDDRHPALPIRKLEHFVELGLILLHVHVLGFAAIGRPGPFGVGSTGLAVDAHWGHIRNLLLSI
jgi:hypothetical protein